MDGMAANGDNGTVLMPVDIPAYGPGRGATCGDQVEELAGRCGDGGLENRAHVHRHGRLLQKKQLAPRTRHIRNFALPDILVRAKKNRSLRALYADANNSKLSTSVKTMNSTCG